jgi:predicted CXXCH cytochrome family protein
MKNHVLRPLWVAIALVASILVIREFLVPEDFGVHGDSFTYNFYRLGSVQDWKDFKVKYQGRERCARCHDENAAEIADSKHVNMQCENCHGPGVDHPKQVKKLPVNTSRELCLRCHHKLEYPGSQRASLKGVNGEKHMKKRECSKCHNPHHPNLEDM